MNELQQTQKIIIFLFIFLLVLLLFSFLTSASITQSNVSPVDGSRHVDMTNNPPDPGGYVNLSVTLTDNTGNDNMEFYLDVYTNSTWGNRQHLIDVGSGTYYQDEIAFNTTCTDYTWRVNAYDPDDTSWDNHTYVFKTDCVPDTPTNPQPSNNSYVEAGYVTLKVDISHPDDDYINTYNVSFFEYPSGRLIGWDYDAGGWNNGTTVTCNTQYFLKYPGQKYYWYACAKDDEYWGFNSSVFNIYTYYNDTISSIYDTMGAKIFILSSPTGEPDSIYYTLGAQINVYYSPIFKYISPSNHETSVTVTPTLKAYAYKEGENTIWDTDFCCNDTLDETWYQKGVTQGLTLGTEIYNLTVYDDPLANGTLQNVTTNVDDNLTLEYEADGNYSLDGNRISPEYNLSGMAYSTKITYSSNKPANTDIVVSYKVYDGTSWGSWTTATNGGAITGISDGDLLDDYKIQFKQQLTTTDNTTTPAFYNLTLKVYRYQLIHQFHGMLNYTTKYWWHIRSETLGVSEMNTSIWDFTTTPYLYSLSSVYDTMGAKIFILFSPSPLPNSIYYTFGANITVYTLCTFSNPVPIDEAQNIRYANPLLIIDLNHSTPKDLDVTFQQNDSGTWIDIYTQSVTTNITASEYHPGMLEYGSQHWWRVKAYNASSDRSGYSSVYSFFIENYTGNVTAVYDTMGAKIFILSSPTPQQDSVYFTMGAQINVGILYISNPYPTDGSTFGVQAIDAFSCYVEDIDNDNMNVTFYYSGGSSWSSVSNIPSATRAESSSLPTLTNSSLFRWYVTVDDGDGWNITSPTWEYTPQNQAPTAWITPEEGNNFVQVNRKSVSGDWRTYVKLLANASDVEDDPLTVKIYVDDPSLPSWDDWILRLSHINDDYTYYSNTLYRQDELLFNKTAQPYTWRFEVGDGYDTVNYYMNFTTEFYFWSYYSWIPEHPTNEDTVTLIDQSVNATDIRWMIDGRTIAEANYSSGSHTPFNVTYKFNLSDLYNISLWVHNDSCNNVEEVNAETTGLYGYLYVDRNVTINATDGEAGYNYYAYHLNDTINASYLAENLSLKDGWWVHKYNSSTGKWSSWWLYPNATSGYGDNFNISLWNPLVITADENMKTRINITNPIETLQNLTISPGYNYIAWSNCTTLSSQNMSIGLGTSDWVYRYNTTTDTWYSEWVGMAGDDFDIHSYDILIIYPAVQRIITVGE